MELERCLGNSWAGKLLDVDPVVWVAVEKRENRRLDLEHLDDVTKACTNLEVTVYSMDAASVDWQQVNALGPRVVYLHFNNIVFYGDDCRGAFAQCSNLRKLSISGVDGNGRLGVTEEMTAYVFAPSLFPKLEQLFLTNLRANERNMRSISSCTGNLKDASPLTSGWDSNVITFQVLVDSNRQLKGIEVQIYSCFQCFSSYSLSNSTEMITSYPWPVCRITTLSEHWFIFTRHSVRSVINRYWKYLLFLSKIVFATPATQKLGDQGKYYEFMFCSFSLTLFQIISHLVLIKFVRFGTA